VLHIYNTIRIPDSNQPADASARSPDAATACLIAWVRSANPVKSIFVTELENMNTLQNSWSKLVQWVRTKNHERLDRRHYVRDFIRKQTIQIMVLQENVAVNNAAFRDVSRANQILNHEAAEDKRKIAHLTQQVADHRNDVDIFHAALKNMPVYVVIQGLKTPVPQGRDQRGTVYHPYRHRPEKDITNGDLSET
jgi:hypothetical protein